MMNRKRRLELGGAVLMAAAAVLFAACEMDPVKRADSNDAGGAETVKEAAPADQAAGVQQDSQTSEKAAEPSPRLERLLNTLYRISGSESNPKIRDWLVWRGTKMIADGKNDEDIGDILSAELMVLRANGPERIDRIVQGWKDKALGVNQSDGWRHIPSLSEKKNRIRKYLHEQYGKPSLPDGMKTPRAVIEILVEGMDDLTAAKYLYDAGRGDSFPEAAGEPWWGRARVCRRIRRPRSGEGSNLARRADREKLFGS